MEHTEELNTENFYELQKELLRKLVKDHPEAAQLLGMTFSLTEAEKRHWEYVHQEYHNPEEGDSRPEALTLRNMVTELAWSCSAACKDDGVDFNQHQTLRVVDAMLTTMAIVGIDQHMLCGDEILEQKARALLAQSPQRQPHLLLINHKHGTNDYLTQSEEMAKQALYGYVKEEWRSEMPKGLAVPDEPEEMVETYFSEMVGRESYSLEAVAFWKPEENIAANASEGISPR